MFKLSNTSWLAVAVVAGLQTLALGYIVANRISLLAHGREIVAEVIPVDPRDFFRGDYVVLGYSFTRTGEIDVPAETRMGDKLYATLKPTGDEKWEIVSVAPTYPASVAPENVVLRALVNHVYRPETGPARASLRYGIESYFVPEGTGRKLEEEVRARKISAVLAVGRSGEVAIKGLKIDGKLVAEEPLL